MHRTTIATALLWTFSGCGGDDVSGAARDGSTAIEAGSVQMDGGSPHMLDSALPTTGPDAGDGATVANASSVAPTPDGGATNKYAGPNSCALPLPSGSVLFPATSAATQVLYATSTRLLAVDPPTTTPGTWQLWDVESGALIESGDGVSGGSIGGDVAVLQVGGSLSVRNADDGTKRGTIAATSTGSLQFGVATDGSYVWLTDNNQLKVFDASGAMLFAADGSYDASQLSAQPGALHATVNTSMGGLNNGSNGTMTLNHYAVPSGTLTSQNLAGIATAWFPGGTRFVVRGGTSTAIRFVTVYTATGEVVATANDLLIGPEIAGSGDWFWGGEPTVNGLYHLNPDATASAVKGLTNCGTPVASGALVACLSAVPGAVPDDIYDLTTNPPSLLRHARGGSTKTFAAAGDKYYFTSFNGALQRWGAHDSSRSFVFSCGVPVDAALAANGRYAVQFTADLAVAGSLDDRQHATIVAGPANGIELSSDGLHLMQRSDGQSTGETVTLTNLSDGSNETPMPAPVAVTFAASADRMLSVYCPDPSSSSCRAKLTTSGGAMSFADVAVDSKGTLYTQLAIGASGRSFAIGSGIGNPVATNLYQDGTMMGSTTGVPLVWTDDNDVVLYRAASKMVELTTVTGADQSALPYPVPPVVSPTVVVTPKPWLVRQGAAVVFRNSTQVLTSMGALVTTLPATPLAANDHTLLTAKGSEVDLLDW